MQLENIMEKNEDISKVLGQTVSYPDQYDPGILVREPRQRNRTYLDIYDDNLPFFGSDTWNAYEVSAITNRGLPISGIAKIVYPCTSKYIVESKSLKLYLNSFNMTSFACNGTEALYNTITHVIARDLSKLLEEEVSVNVFSASKHYEMTDSQVYSHEVYHTLEDILNLNGISFNSYNEDPTLLRPAKKNIANSTRRYHSSLLKSNCKVTSQPDWGDIYIRIRSKYDIDLEGLLKYIVSFRDECHFHEEICEAVYKRLHDRFNPTELCVTCLYARRGGIDINPTRASSPSLLNTKLIFAGTPHQKTSRQ
jgi:7-cyano-7-deazaguanine reductase